MLSNPRRGLFVALAVMALCLAWFVASAVFETRLRDALGMNRHAITYFAIVVLIFAAAAAFVFARFAAVRDELLAGRRVLASWRVDPRTWAAVAPAAFDAEARDKRSALIMVLVFVFVAFGAVALADPEAASGMTTLALLLAAAFVVAFLLGRRALAAHARLRDGIVVVGERGLLSNGVLHVWALPLSRLRGARLDARPPVLTVAYAWRGRSGWQGVSVDLPVPPAAWREAAICRDALDALASGGGRGRGPRPPVTDTAPPRSADPTP